jgi:hypothetical protein
MMAAAVRSRLEAAYRNTDYCVRLSSGDLLLKVDRHSESDNRRLRTEAGIASHWAIVTACNPQSRALSAETNRKRQDEFQAVLQTLAIRHVSSVNRDPQGRWPDEPGFLLCDPAPGEAEQLGRRFEQNALLCARLGQAPQLLWLID